MNKNQKLPWFRLYSKTVDDEKLRLLAFEDRWHFIALLCLHGDGKLDTSDPLMMRKVAVKMGLDVRSLEEAARRLSEVGLIEKDTLHPVKWDELQMRSDADSTAGERKRRQRQREREELEAAAKANAEGHAGAAGEPSEEQNVTVTDQSRVTVTDVTRTDIDIDIDIDTKVDKTVINSKAVGASPSAPTASKAKSGVGTRLPENWVLPKSWGDWALGEQPGMDEGEVRRQAELFADHWRAAAGAKARKADWLATWRTWIRRADEFKGKKANHSGGGGQASAANKNSAAYSAILGG